MNNRMTVRDFHDLTKIILQDAIRDEKKRLEKVLPNKPAEHKEIREEAAKLALKGVTKWPSNDIQFASKETQRNVLFNYYGQFFSQSIKSDCVHVEVSEAMFEKLVAMINKHGAERNRHTEERRRLQTLEQRLSFYKDIADRFRIEYKGDSADREATRKACAKCVLADRLWVA